MVKIDEKKLIRSFDRIKQELEDHLDSINDNTNEIQTNYEYLCDIDQKMSKMNERIDELHYILEKLLGSRVSLSKYSLTSPLNMAEQEVFLTFYTLSEGKTLTIQELARKCAIDVKMAKSYLASIRQKGIPVKNVIVNDQNGYFLETEFRNFQAKNNIVKINEKLLKNI